MENKEINSNDSKAVQLDEKLRRQAVSKSYLVRAFGTNIGKLKETGLVDNNTYEELKKLHKKVVEMYVGQQLL